MAAKENGIDYDMFEDEVLEFLAWVAESAPDSKRHAQEIRVPLTNGDTKIQKSEAEIQKNDARMKKYIIENSKYLSMDVKKAILGVVMMEVGTEAVKRSGLRDTEIDLDKCSAKNGDIIRHIHNMVRARLDTLSKNADESAAVAVATVTTAATTVATAAATTPPSDSFRTPQILGPSPGRKTSKTARNRAKVGAAHQM